MIVNTSDESKAEILIVDDMPNNLRLLSTILGNNGYEVRKAVNGEMALNSIAMAPPDLILLDIKMPKMDGYETCKRLKQDHQLQSIPVVFISAIDDVMDKVKAFSIGGVDYITKPFQQEEVLARVENQLRIQFLNRELGKRNKTLQDLNIKLAESNQRLHDFSNMVSHDLKQPLQSIMGFSNLILMQYQSSLDEPIVKHLNRINQAGDRMQEFIQKLLSFAQLEQLDRPFQPINCTAILSQVIDHLSRRIQETDAIISCDPLPTVMGYDVQLMQLFQNIIGNSLKYMHLDRQPILRITGTSTETHHTISIEDNGIGIAPESLSHIFEPFQRAHQGDYEGNGMGLAICKKIMTLHHGHISVDSDVSSGTTFMLTFPNMEQANMEQASMEQASMEQANPLS